ncbi:DNA repair protein RAD16 [Symbiodinium microadriaticum]|uniref:DNA repair protein RAD16 n=1 Tax=Symbiodinium microadriaticum TaxID=2951 RepID=A0A1Q9CUX7_SYMMI|nr:DNA repair protein RAD16 [Symbiodinium microadriaticum]
MQISMAGGNGDISPSPREDNELATVAIIRVVREAVEATRRIEQVELDLNDQVHQARRCIQELKEKRDNFEEKVSGVSAQTGRSPGLPQEETGTNYNLLSADYTINPEPASETYYQPRTTSRSQANTAKRQQGTSSSSSSGSSSSTTGAKTSSPTTTGTTRPTTPEAATGDSPAQEEGFDVDAGFNELMAWTPPPGQEEEQDNALPSRTGVLRGLTSLEAGAPRAIPRANTAEMSALDEQEHHARTETEYNNYVYYQGAVQGTDAKHACHEATEDSREERNNDTYYQDYPLDSGRVEQRAASGDVGVAEAGPGAHQDKAEWRERWGYLYDNGAEPPAKGRRKGIMQKIKTAEFQSSTKIEALLQEIQKMQAADPSSKALVFSQFTRFLELIEWRLKREGISAATVLGSMPIVSRNNIIVSFQTEPSLKVLLISLKAGGEGLNLQAADHIFLMDPWWNPAAEAQAIQRAHRIGQTRPVKATRFVAANTIEEKIIELQEKKQTVFDCTVGNSNQALQRLTAEDIQFLFSSS